MATVKLNPVTGKVSGTHSDMPLVIIPSEITNLGSLTQAEADSCRIYSDSSLTTELAREVKSNDEIHVKVSSVSSSTEIWFDYDGVRSDYGATDTYGRNAVWSGYEAVYHFNESSGNAIDSTSNSNDGSNTGVGYGGTGKIGNAYDYDTDSDRTETTANSNGETNIVISMWVNWDGDRAGQRFETMISSWTDASNALMGIRHDASNPGFELFVRDGSGTKLITTAEGNISTGAYTHIWIDLDASNGIEWFHDNTSAGTAAYGESTFGVGTPPNYVIGNDPASLDRSWNGFIDEVKIYHGSLSSDWRTTEYNNQSDNGAFWEATAVTTFNSAIPRRRIFLKM